MTTAKANFSWCGRGGNRNCVRALGTPGAGAADTPSVVALLNENELLALLEHEPALAPHWPSIKDQITQPFAVTVDALLLAGTTCRQLRPRVGGDPGQREEAIRVCRAGLTAQACAPLSLVHVDEHVDFTHARIALRRTRRRGQAGHDGGGDGPPPADSAFPRSDCRRRKCCPAYAAQASHERASFAPWHGASECRRGRARPLCAVPR